MANTVYTVEEVILEDDSLITLKPANIAVMRKGQEMINNLGDTENEDDGIRRLLDIVCLCLKRQRPEFEHEVETEEGGKRKEPNYEIMEELFDLDTVFKVIEVYLGVKLNDPKLIEEAMKVATQQMAKDESSAK